MSRRPKTWLIAGTLLLAAAGAVWWLVDGSSSKATAKDGNGAGDGVPPGMPVEAARVTVAPIAREIVAVGSLRSDESVIVRPEIAGRIASIAFKEGEPVAQGALLFQLDDSIYRAEVEQARANFELSKRNYERAVEMFNRKLISARERDEAAAKRQVDQAALNLAQARLAKMRIGAPFPAIAGLRRVSPGDYVDAGAELVNLESLDPIKVDFRVAETALPALAVGQKLSVEVDAYPNETFEGTVYAIDPRIQDNNRSVALRARLPNRDLRLKPGLFARVRLAVQRDNDAILVPEQAIVPQGDKLFVYVIEDGRAQLRPVVVGLRRSGQAEIVSGLKDDDIVITAGQQKIGPGSPVMAINLQPAAGKSAPTAGG